MRATVQIRENTRFIVPMTGSLDPGRVGNKAANLGRLIGWGFQVPAAFVVTSDATDAFLEENGLLPAIEALSANRGNDQPQAVGAASREVRDRMLAAEIPTPIRDAVRVAHAELPSGVPLAVRSSATGEDSRTASFAGQFDTFLGIRGGEELEQAVRACWASLWSERAVAYRQARGETTGSMAVIVQVQIPSHFSGILFTVSPLDTESRPRRMLGECIQGTGEALASGRVNPSRFRIVREDWSLESIEAGETGTAGVADMFDVLTRERLGPLASRMESRFGEPQDIEWTVDQDGKLFFLQSRPVTAAVPIQPVEASSQVILWSNANIAENFPDPVCPLIYSVASMGYFHYFRNLGVSFGIRSDRIRAMEQPLREIIGVHGARLYYNMTRIRQVLALAPCGALLGEFFDRFIGGDSSTAAVDRTAPQGTPRERAVEIARIVVATTRQYVTLGRRIRRFELTIDSFADRTRPALLEDRTLTDLGSDLNEFREIRCHRWNDAALADTAAMVCYGVLGRLMQWTFPMEDAPPAHLLLEGSPQVISVGSVTELWKLAKSVRMNPALRTLFEDSDSRSVLERIRTEPEFGEFRAGFERYLEEWGFRCSGELMLTVPSFQERPEPLVDLLRSYVESDIDSPFEAIGQGQASSSRQETRIFERLNTRRYFPYTPRLAQVPVFRLILAATHRSVGFRERARLKQALLYSRLRRVVLAIGARLSDARLLDQPESVFFLTLDELDELVSGRSMFPRHLTALVALRRQAHAEVSESEPPNSFELARGEYTSALQPSSEGEQQCSLQGVSACGGQVQGRAVVLHDVKDAHTLRKGDILVTRQTDPGWAPAFFMARGLVMERGGILSHGAVLAREFGIPAVVAVEDATRRIQTGDIIAVEGNTGHVHLRN